MAEPDGTADVNEQPAPDDDTAPGVAGEEEEDGELDAAAPRRRLVSELLEGQDELGDSASDLQLVATPVHIEPVESGQAVYQLDLSGGEPEGTLLEPEPVSAEAGSISVGLPDGAVRPVPNTTAADAHGAVRELVAQRDRLVMAAERDGVSAYELAAGIDEFVDAVVDSVRHYDRQG